MIMLNELLSGAASALLSDTDGDGKIQAVELFNKLSEQSGGIGGLLNQLQTGNFASIVQSWISTGSNIQPQPSQIENALGDTLGKVAASMGMNSSQASSLLAQFLPQIINTITPNGNVTEANNFSTNDIARIALQQIFK